MTGLAVARSATIGLSSTGNPGSFSVAAGTLALAILRSTKNETPAPHRRRRKKEESTKTFRNSKGPEVLPQNALVRLYGAWLTLPQIFRFFVAGNLGNIGFFYLEKVVFQLLSSLLIVSTEAYSVLLDTIEAYQDGLSFFTAYVIQIVTTHLLYAFLVYGMDTINTYEKYSKTLWGQFKVYGFGLFGATALNTFLIGRGGMDKTWAFWTTTATFAGVNYLLISKVVRNVVESTEPVGPPETPKLWGSFAVKQKEKPLSVVKRVRRGGETNGCGSPFICLPHLVSLGMERKILLAQEEQRLWNESMVDELSLY